MSDVGNYVMDDELAYPALHQLGWHVEAVPWDSQTTDWSAFDGLVIRSTWDYQLRPAEFLAALQKFNAAGMRLENPVDVVSWNMQKTYLRDLDAGGIDIVPSYFADQLASGALHGIFDAAGADEVVLKPQLGATASGAYRLHRDSYRQQQAEVEQYYEQTPMLVQPFLINIESEGEYSLFFFNGELSHVVLKTPKQGDFRSQEEHGSRIQLCRDPEPSLLEAAGKAIAAIGRELLYARVDLVRANGGNGFQLMELELVEPALYLRTDPDAPARFARAIDQRFAGAPARCGFSRD